MSPKHGNRVDRFLAAVAYLDGSRPSVIMCRGYYTRTVLAAWNWRDGSLSHVWTFDSDDGTPGNRSYRGQGNHNLRVGDVDGDGKDEIVYGACVIDDNGKGLYTTGLGHGDAIHLCDIDPDRPGLEVFDIHEVIWRTTDGKELRIYTTTIPTAHRFYTLMHDPIYRLSVAYQNVGYNQPTQTGFYLGDGMSQPPRPAIVTRSH